ncbi:MAG: class I SAM-dependent methyltransferase [Zoogloeaceae bacterium]|jgi:protein-L-isoaspartate O-methyltransferase|nr:class I SAM-dependent methyltransferase [Zoogloeaceae bacterium]
MSAALSSPADFSSLDFLARWEEEGKAHQAYGDYDWMADRLPPDVTTVLEIGCGAGYSTLALLKKGYSVLALDNREECLSRAAESGERPPALSLLHADLRSLTETAKKTLQNFRPDAIVCWLMGASAEDVGVAANTTRDEMGRFVAAYRETLHRAVALLANDLSSVRYAHLVDRTAIPWQGKEHGREILAQYHLRQTFSGLPFAASRRDSLYRKLETGAELTELRHTHPGLKSVAPALASLCLKRINLAQS